MSRPTPGAPLQGVPFPLGAPSGIAPRPWLARAAAITAGVGAVADMAAFGLLTLAGVRLEFAQAGAYALGVVAAAATLRGLREAQPAARAGPGLRIVLVVVALAYLLRAGVLSLAAFQGAWPVLVAIVPAALAGALAGGLGIACLHSVPRDGTATAADSWRSAAWLGVAYMLALRIVYLGQLELVPQEAYYWNFARHLDIGYLDHPPLTAWLIALSTSAGDGEFFVRLPALLSWCVMAVFAALYARESAGAAVAPRAALLASVLPFFFLIGWLVTPDAPLAAAWAAALYCLHRALIDGHRPAWIGAGAAIGIGMLSKYSMVLVPAAALVFVMLDARSRGQLTSPWLWAGALVALVAFSPVILWNLQHEWASFAFQGSRRLAGQGPRFDFHRFLLYVLIVITPWGVAGLASALARLRRELSERRANTDGDRADDTSHRRRRFALVFTLVPLAAFAVPSFWSETKMHWTGPIWLASLPLIAASVAPAAADRPAGAAARVLAATWVPALHTLMIGFAFALFYYPVFGLAGLRAHHDYLYTGWRDLRAQVQAIEEEVLRETGRRPAVVGLDKHNTADEMAYYDPRGDGARDTGSRHLFYDEPALMYEFWFPPRAFDGRDLVVVSGRRGDVEDVRVGNRATRLGPVHTLDLVKRGRPAGRYYARVVYGYRAPSRPAATASGPTAAGPVAPAAPSTPDPRP